MKYFKSYILFALMALTFAGCKTDDLKDDLDDLKDRVTLLEEQVKILNDNVEVFAYVLNPDNKTIYDVVEGNDSYTIILSNGEELQLTLGSQGTVETPTIEVNDEGYWVINGVATTYKAKGEAGDNLIPEFRINQSSGKWEVRYGEDADWEVVEGEYNVDAAGDKFFESAEVQGDTFVITGKDGDKYEMPIVRGLKCMIDGDDVVEFQPGERKTFDVTIEGDGEPLAPIYPEGWRAELIPQTEAGKYTLTVYAPSSTSSTLSRATANNSEEVVVRANKGVFWAVDKIKVRLPKEYANDWEAYNDGATIYVGGIPLSRDKYGESTDISTSQDITTGGVYFVTAYDLTLTIKTDVEFTNLIILTKSADIANLTVSTSNKISVSGAFICKNLNLTRNGNYVWFENKSSDVEIVLDGCKIEDNYLTNAWVKGSGELSLKSFIVENSDIKINSGGQVTGFINSLSCENLSFVNNIVFYSGTISSDTKEADHLNNFKIFSGNTNKISVAKINNNTFVDVETTYAKGVTGMIYSNEISDLQFNNNIYYLTYPFTAFSPNNQKNTVLLRSATYNIVEGKNNYAYSGNSDMSVKICYSNAPAGIDELIIKDDLFSTNNKQTGTFIPNDSYKSYGAQR